MEMESVLVVIEKYSNITIMYGWWTKKTGTKMTTIQIEIWQICTV
jgi:hypothetical protein